MTSTSSSSPARIAISGRAMEASLKIAEMSGVPAAAFALEEMLHGRLHGLTVRSLGILIAADAEQREASLRAAAVMAEHGVRIDDRELDERAYRSRLAVRRGSGPCRRSTRLPRSCRSSSWLHACRCGVAERRTDALSGSCVPSRHQDRRSVMTPVLAIDIGGTAIKIGIVAARGRILRRRLVPFDSSLQFDALVERIHGACSDLLADVAPAPWQDCDRHAGLFPSGIGTAWSMAPATFPHCATDPSARRCPSGSACPPASRTTASPPPAARCCSAPAATTGASRS